MAKLVNPWLAAIVAMLAGPMAAHTPPAARGQELTFKIATPLEFKGRVVSGFLRQSDIPQLLDLPVRNGDTDLAEGYGVQMTRPNNTKFMVYTCLEWRNAQAEGSYSATTYDMAMESFFNHTCGLLFELQKAKLPAESFIANPRVTLADLDLLPAEMLASMPVGGAADRARRGKTIKQVVPPQDVIEADADGLTVSYGGLRQSFWVGARADFNGDGIEDILIFTGGRAEGGTMGYSDYFILTRTSPSGPLKLIQTADMRHQGDK
jgi:hypothetical protein